MDSKVKYDELWKNICFLLSDNLDSEIDENAFLKEIILVFEKLGWSQYRKELVEKPQIQVGSPGIIYPDILVQSSENGISLFVIEVKKPSLDSNSTVFVNQLKSFMRQKKCELGLIIGNRISIYWGDRKSNHDEFHKIDQIDFIKEENNSGIDFVQAFLREDFVETDKILSYINFRIKAIHELSNYSNARKHFLSIEFKEELLDHIKNVFKPRMNEAYHSKMINDIVIDLYFKSETPFRNQNPNSINSIIMDNYAPAFKTGFQRNHSQRYKDTTKYSFEGNIYGKGKLVLAVINKYVKDNIGITYSRLESIFPKYIQGSHGVFTTSQKAHDAFSHEKRKRHFLSNQELIKLMDATVAVSSQWGIFNITKFIEIAKELNYTIQVIDEK